MSKYRILSLDGGGVRGLVTVVILERLQQTFPGLLGNVDLMAGTSTGALIALGLRKGKTLAEIREIYMKRSKDIFRDNLWDDIKDVGGITGAQYETKHRRKVFKQEFGDKTRLKNLNGRVLVPAFDLDNKAPAGQVRCWKPKVFHNFPGSDTDGNEHVFKVALYTTAAPTYFPSVDGYIDGGLFANNPSMCALAQCQDKTIGATPALADVRLLSLGTGINREFIPGKSLDWGLAQWMPRIFDVMMDGSMDVDRYHCEQLLGQKFMRYAPYLPSGKKVKLDGVKQLGWLKNWAQNLDLSELEQWVQQHW